MRKIGLYLCAAVVLAVGAHPAQAKVANCTLDYVFCVHSCGPINQMCLSACATAYSNCTTGTMTPNAVNTPVTAPEAWLDETPAPTPVPSPTE
jgi:hypothetical protein